MRLEAVDRRQADEHPADRALADERDPRGAGYGKRRELVACGEVERRPTLLVTDRDAEPARSYGARVGAEALDVLCDAAVLGDRATGHDPGQDGGCGRDPERRPERVASTTAEPAEREPHDVAGTAHVSAPRRRR